MDYTNEQLKAAYALNLCTVSVSQIIDYNDVNIMEQEYEAILNNLNLEQMPKDEALLSILKQLLDVITYFRIQDGDKKFLEKEYQQRMKNAIWSAVPNIGLIVAGGNPVTMAVSLASQIGIGYMNYRREKSDANSELEKQKWQLERSAMEQFNGLRRELFDTAWRLSDKYNFPDKLRLTERQIHQYNDILMDNDLIRKYNRLDTIKDEFTAYPPFWYQFGSTANAISRSELPLSDDTRLMYRNTAREHLVQYRKVNQQGLLREDQVACSCALELVDLLDVEKDKNLILELLDEAVTYSGRANDILQLASMSYLKLNDRESACKLLKQLVNEQYNTVINAQLLSSIYVADYIENKSISTCAEYDILSAQVGNDYLFPMPKVQGLPDEALNNEFTAAQKQILLDKYYLVMDRFIEKYDKKFNCLIPEPQNRNSEDSFAIKTLAERKYEMSKVFAKPKDTERYLDLLVDTNVRIGIVELLNELFEAVSTLDVMNETVSQILFNDIEKGILENREKVNDCYDKIESGEFDIFAMNSLLEMSLMDYASKFFDDLFEALNEYVNSRTEMQDFALSEQNLTDFCLLQNIPDPAILYGKDGSESVDVITDERKHLDIDLWGDGNVSTITDFKNLNQIKETIDKYIPEIVYDSQRVEFYTDGDPRIERYFRNGKDKLSKNYKLKSQVIAILDDKTEVGDCDLLFTRKGLVPVKNGVAKSLVEYKSVTRVPGEDEYLEIGSKFKVDSVNYERLFSLCVELDNFAQIDAQVNVKPKVDYLKNFKNMLKKDEE